MVIVDSGSVFTSHEKNGNSFTTYHNASSKINQKNFMETDSKTLCFRVLLFFYSNKNGVLNYLVYKLCDEIGVYLIL